MALLPVQALRKVTKNAYLDGENEIFHKLLMYFLAVNWAYQINQRYLLNIFQCFFTDKLIQDIAENTVHLYSVPKWWKSVNTNVEEIEEFIGMNIIMGVIPLRSVYDYWSRSLRILVIADVMPRNLFLELRRYLHFVVNTATHDIDD